MFIEQMYTNCLAQAAYYIESNGEAAIVDPIRDYNIYIEKAKSRNANIKYIFETHFHADFVSGHLDLARATGAKIIFGSNAICGYDCYSAEDNEIFALGNCEIKVLHTPGHTPESCCFLLIDENKKIDSVFTGDTLFIGDVGRPDLCQASADLTTEKMAVALYQSLNSKIKTLPDDVKLFPGHGPGSACGKNIGPETFGTIGKEKLTNYALLAKDEKTFVEIVTKNIVPPPSYFFADAGLNKNGYDEFDSIINNAKTLTANDVIALRKEGAVILDTRDPNNFETGFIPHSLNIGLSGQYAIWAATLLALDRKIIIVAEPHKETESIERLTRVGFNNIAGCLENGIEEWKKLNLPLDMIISITAEEFALDYKYSNDTILDVRKNSEWEQGHLEDAQLQPLDNLFNTIQSLNKETNYIIHCAGGYRSMIAASLLKQHGYDRVKNVYGGFNAIKETDINIVKEVGETV